MERITFREASETTAQAVGSAALRRMTGEAAVPEGESAVTAGKDDGQEDVASSPSYEEENVGVEPGVRRSPLRRREADRPTLANVYTDPRRHTVSLLLDDRTANAVIYAVRVFMADLEAHAREARLASTAFPEDSYGAVNRLAIAGRHERLAARLRKLEGNYLEEVGGGWAPE